jgi:hypothetical protein
MRNAICASKCSLFNVVVKISIDVKYTDLLVQNSIFTAISRSKYLGVGSKNLKVYVIPFV